MEAGREIENAMAEMRMSINDARRLRSGERRALSELRKTTEDVAERVQKAEGSRKDAKERVKGLKRCFTYILYNYIIYSYL